MQDHISTLLSEAVKRMQTAGELPTEIKLAIQITRTKDKAHGDYASNLAMQLAKPAKLPPREIASKLVEHLEDDPLIDKVDIAGPGFLNFYVQSGHQAEVLNTILSLKKKYGYTDAHKGKKLQIEFVSANPTGPLHVGHGRGAAYGATIANLHNAVGYEVQREYYVNDAGRQIDILSTSVWLRYLELCGEEFTFPSNAYQGDYIWDIAASLHREHENVYLHATKAWMSDLPADEPQGGDKEIYIDAVIAQAKSLLGNEGYEVFAKQALNVITDDIKDDLEKFGVHFDNWYSEKSLVKNDKIKTALQTLENNEHSYEKNGAVWFRSTAFGDEKDRVLVRENGSHTYFASDIAYHLDKFQRGFHQLINIWGADHHGYIARVHAAIQALGEKPDKLKILLVQFANLYQGGEKLAMSTRSGEFVTLRELRKKVGKDAARFFYVMRKCEQHLDFDLDLATSQTKDNPVFYVQYAHARICSIFTKAEQQYPDIALDDTTLTAADSTLLENEHEKILMTLLDQLPEKIINAVEQLSPHILVNYLRELAKALQSFYDSHKVLIDDHALRNARFKLLRATQIVLQNGLALLDVSAPNKM